MRTSPFKSDAALGSRRAIIRRNPVDMQEVEMVDAASGLAPLDNGGRPFKFVRSEGGTFPEGRCLVPSEGDWLLSYAVITIEANPDILRCREHQGAVLLRRQTMAWLDLTLSEAELLVPMPPRSFRVEEVPPRHAALRESELVL